jgi:hypothetical protein
MGEREDPRVLAPWRAVEAAARYRVDLLVRAEVRAGGVAFREGATVRLLPWDRVLRALAAQVGEPEGVSTVVFDLVVERKATECLVYRFDADPGEPARGVARALVDGLGRDRCARSLLDLADEGHPSRAYEDLGALAEGALAELGLG